MIRDDADPTEFSDVGPETDWSPLGWRFKHGLTSCDWLRVKSHDMAYLAPLHSVRWLS